jgi:Cna protein B-type domain./Gram positive anchor.
MTKVRITNKLVAIISTIMMFAAMVMPAMAAPNTGKITVTKLGGTQASNVVNQNGEAVALPAGYTALAGAGFTLYRVNPTELATLQATFSATRGIASHTVNDTVTPPTVVFTLTDSTTATIATQAVGTQQVTPANGIITFGPNLTDGWYVLVETQTPENYDKATSSMIQLPMTYTTGANAGKANYDVHVYPKNVSNLGLAVKDMTGTISASLSNGDTATFDLKAKFQNSAEAPNKVNGVADLKDGTTYGTARITEQFHADFKLSGNISVFWLGADGNINPSDPVAPALYTETPTAGSTAVAGAAHTITLNNAGIDAAIAGNKLGFGLRLTAEYVGNPTGAAGAPATLSNKVISEMRPANGDGTEDPDGDKGIIIEGETNIPSISIKVTKVDQEDTNVKLAGVVFELAKVAVPTTDADYVMVGGQRLRGTTDSDGLVSFSNLPGYVDTELKFYLKEVETRSGYQLKNGTIEVTFKTKAAYQADATKAAWFDGSNWSANAVIIEEVEVTNAKIGTQDRNEPGFSLPLTGGAGTFAFTAIGIIVMLGAAGLYMYGKKRNAAE